MPRFVKWRGLNREVDISQKKYGVNIQMILGFSNRLCKYILLSKLFIF